MALPSRRPNCAAHAAESEFAQRNLRREVLANYAYINLNDQLTRVRASAACRCSAPVNMNAAVGQTGSTGQLGITVPEIVSGLFKTQNRSIPRVRCACSRLPPGQEFTYSVSCAGRRGERPCEDFGARSGAETPDGGIRSFASRMWRVWSWGHRTINHRRSPSTGQAQRRDRTLPLPGSNGVQQLKASTKLMAEAKKRFPEGMTSPWHWYTTRAVTEASGKSS